MEYKDHSSSDDEEAQPAVRANVAYTHDDYQDSTTSTAAFYSEPVRAGPVYETSTVDFGRGPVRVGPIGDFNRGKIPVSGASVAPPVRIVGGSSSDIATAEFQPRPVHLTTDPFTNVPKPFHVFHNIGGETPLAPVEPPETPHYALIRAASIFHSLAFLFLLIALAIIASNSETLVALSDDCIGVYIGVKLDYSNSTSTKYLLATLIICIIYEFIQTGYFLTNIWQCMEIPVQGYSSQYISYVGNQVIAALLLTSGAASAAYLKDLDVLGICTIASKFCNKAIASISITFIAFLFVGANVLISSFLFYTNKP